MSIERRISDELDTLLSNVRITEQNIVREDSSDKLKIVKRLIELEDTIKSIRDEIVLPEIQITEDTLIEELKEEKILTLRAANVLRRSGCRTVKDITEHTIDEIASMRNMGIRPTKEIEAFLINNGFSLKE